MLSRSLVASRGSPCWLCPSPRKERSHISHLTLAFPTRDRHCGLRTTPSPKSLATLCDLAAQRDSSKTPGVCGFVSSADSLRWLLKHSLISEAPYLGHVHSQRWCARSARSPRTLRDGLTFLNMLPKLTSFFGARRTQHLFSLAWVRSDPRCHVSSSLFDSQTFKKKQDLFGSPASSVEMVRSGFSRGVNPGTALTSSLLAEIPECKVTNLKCGPQEDVYRIRVSRLHTRCVLILLPSSTSAQRWWTPSNE